MQQEGGGSGLITFWTTANEKEVRALAKQAELGFNFVVTGDAPGGALTLVMGSTLFKTMQTRGFLPKNRTIDSCRGQVFQGSFGKFMVTFDPGLQNLQADAYQQIIWDIRLVKRFAKSGSLKPILGKYRWTEDFSELIEKIEEMYEKTGEAVDVAVDTETMDLWPWYAHEHKEIVTVQASCEEGTADVVYTRGMDPKLKSQFIVQLKWLLTSRKVKIKGANWKYDAVWLYVHWGIECTNFTMDTTAVGSLLNENRSNSLKWHIKEHCDDLGGYDDEMKSTYDMGHMELIPKGPLLNYAAPDADGTLRVSNIFRKKLSEERLLQRFYVKLLHPALKAYEKVERRGVYIDAEKIATLRSYAVGYIAERDKKLLSMLSPRLRAKYAEKIQDQKDNGKAPITSAMLLDHFFDKSLGMGLKPRLLTEKSQKPSTAHEHLVMFADNAEAAPFVNLMDEVNQARKTVGTFIDGFMKHRRPDGYFHPTYMLFNGEMYDDGSNDGGTVTGRLSCKGPALQTLSKHSDWGKRIRQCFTAPDGKICWEFDFSQGELRIAACDADETKMIEAYKQGIDVHAITGSTFAGCTVQELLALKKFDKGTEEKLKFEKYRQRGKHANFGMIFEISADGFQVYCRRKELHITVQEAGEYLEKFFETWPRLRPWQSESKAFARQHGVSVSPLGRIRHLPLIRSRDGYIRSSAERQAINAKIQSTLSDLCIWAVSFVEEELGDKAGVVGTTHDSMYGYCDPADAVWLLPRIREIMLGLPYREVFGWEPALTFPVDCKVGPNMAEMSEIEDWSKLPEAIGQLKLAA